MTSIFISYARADKERIGRLVERLEVAGHTVWWDDKIQVGNAFDEQITANIAKVDCAIVVWSKHSIESQWVRAEATFAQNATTLLPIKIDPVNIPLPFNLLHTANLAEWDFESSHREFTALLQEIQSLAGKSTGATPVQPAATSEHNPDDAPTAPRKQKWFAALVTAPVVVGVIGTIVSMLWHVPTQIEALLPVCSVRMSLQDGVSIPLLDTQSLSSVTFEHATRAKLAPVTVQALNTASQESCWVRSLVLGQENVLTGKDFALVAGRDSANERVSLQAISLSSPVVVVVENPAGCHSPQGLAGRLRIKLEQANQVFYVNPANSLYIDAGDAKIEGSATNQCTTGPASVITQLAQGSPYLEVKGGTNQVALVLAPLRNSGDVQLFGTAGVHFDHVVVARQDDANGRPVTALHGQGVVNYPGYSGKQAKRVSEDEVVKVSNVIGHVRYDTKADRIWLSLSGRVATFEGKSPGGTVDYRLTLFEQLWHRYLPMTLFTIGVLMVAVTAGSVGLYKSQIRQRG